MTLDAVQVCTSIHTFSRTEIMLMKATELFTQGNYLNCAVKKRIDADIGIKESFQSIGNTVASL